MPLLMRYDSTSHSYQQYTDPRDASTIPLRYKQEPVQLASDSPESERTPTRVVIFPRGTKIQFSFHTELTHASSNDILQHIAEYHRSRRSTNAPVFGQHHPSYSTTAPTSVSHEKVAEAQHAFNNIEAEIDVLKQDVMKLRNESDKGRNTPKTEQELAMDRFLSTRSKKTAKLTSSGVEESAAARLQRLHETQDMKHDEPVPQTQPTPPPTASDFPDLSQTVKPTSRRPTKSGQPRQASYAQAAANGMMDAIGSAFAASNKSGSQAKCTKPTTVGTLSTNRPDGSSNMDCTWTNSTNTTQDPFDSTAEDGSVIIATDSKSMQGHSTKVSTPVVPSDVSRNSKSTKHVPHFAQPTKAFTSRAGDLRSKDSASSLSPISPKESSPTKTLKAKELAQSTAKHARQNQQKRKSLPEGWITAPESKSSPVGHAATTKIPTPKKTKAKEGKTLSPPRKQTQSYMAPTAAAVQRNMATLGSVNPSSQESEVGSEFHAGDAHTGIAMTEVTRPSTTLSETSSVCFILDRPNGLTNSPVSGRTSSMESTPSISSTHYQHKVDQMPLYATPHSAPLSSTPRAPRPMAPTQRMPKGRQAGPGQDTTPLRTYASVAGVANTVTKRRTSHGHLLAPIVERLASRGLLNKEGQNVTPSRSELSNKETSVFQSFHANEGSSMEHHEAPLEGLGVSYGTAAMGVLPPHLRRSRETSTASTSTNVSCQHRPATPKASKYHDRFMEPSISEERRDSVMGVTAPAAIPAQAVPRVQQQTRVPSLRPTADVFEPRKPIEDFEATNNIELSSRFVPDQEWFQLSPERRDRIQYLRAVRGNRGWNPVLKQCMPFDGFSPFGNSFFGPVEGTSHSRYDGSLFPPHQMYPSKTFSGVHAGQILTPSISPGRKSVTWKLKDLDGTETPIRFGRAPPPVFDPSTPTISSTSDDTGPLITPSPAPGWRIGSTYNAMPYGWKGGDGKEISFMGYGPHAERSVIQPVAFDFKGTNSRYAPDVSNGFVEEEKENDAPLDFVVPRSQRQWAEKLGYPKIPCGNVEVTDAVESMPGSSQLNAYCFDCEGR